jgi:DNA modification methylase
MSVDLYCGDCRDVLPTLPDASVDAIITDPPYPEIDRPYGRLTEAEWWDLMMVVCREARRILKPTGSAVFILQPNSRKVGSMRGWLFEFQAWACREWNMVQDAWWFNIQAPPTVHSNRTRGLMRPSLKAAVWLGSEDCFRDQAEILNLASKSTLADKRCDDDSLDYSPSGHHGKFKTRLSVCRERGGVTPFNVLAVGHGSGGDHGGKNGHGASTPTVIADNWTRYICPPGGTCLDPFLGGGTMALAALKRGRSFIGIEKMENYFDISVRRIEAEGVLLAPPLVPLFDWSPWDVA